MTDTPLLTLENIGVRYGKHLALTGLTFTLRAGEILALIGESGSGKTTAARAIMGLTPACAGHIRFQGEDITHLTGKARRRIWRRMQMVFQDPSASLSPRLTIAAIIAEPLLAHGHSAAAAQTKAKDLLDLVGLPQPLLTAPPTALSGGQRQRVAIARALALEPKLIVADEPMSALDVSVKAQIANLFVDIRDRTGTAFLIVAHDLALMAGIADNAVVLQSGKLVEQGPMTAMMQTPAEDYTKMLRDACLDPFELVAGR